MRSHFLFAALVTLAIASVASAQTPATKIAPQKGWLNDLPTAKALAQKTGKPLMIVFRCDP